MGAEIINNHSSATGKKSYQKPEILRELLLETKAGTPIPPTPLIAPIIIMPGGFTIDDEP